MDNEKKIAFFDLDGTLVSAHLWIGLIKHHFRAKEKIFSAFWFIISHMALMPFWKMHLIPTKEYYKSWARDMADLIKGINVDRAKEIFNWLSDEYLLPTLRKNVFERLKKHQEEGFLTVLISGSFSELLEIIASRLNIDFAIGTDLETVENKYSGKVVPPLCFGEGKVEKIKKFLSEKYLQVNFKESFAYSDSFFDLPLLKLVGNPVVVEPDEKLLEIARKNNWQII